MDCFIIRRIFNFVLLFLLYVPRPTTPITETGRFLYFRATDPADSAGFRSIPLSFDEVLTTGFWSGFRKIPASNSSEIDDTDGS